MRLGIGVIIYMVGNKEYLYVGKNNHVTKVTYNFQGVNQVKAFYEEDERTALVALYDGNDILYDLQVESKITGGGTNLIFALIDFCFAIRKTEGIEIHRIKGKISSLDKDENREIYRAIYEKLKREMDAGIELKYYDDNYEELPFDQASYSQKYKGKVRYLEFILP